MQSIKEEYQRKPFQLGSLVKKQKFEIQWKNSHQKLVDRDSNLADAFVLALSMKLFRKEAFQIEPTQEGWILGVPPLRNEDQR